MMRFKSEYFARLRRGSFDQGITLHHVTNGELSMTLLAIERAAWHAEDQSILCLRTPEIRSIETVMPPTNRARVKSACPRAGTNTLLNGAWLLSKLLLSNPHGVFPPFVGWWSKRLRTETIKPDIRASTTYVLTQDDDLAPPRKEHLQGFTLPFFAGICSDGFALEFDGAIRLLWELTDLRWCWTEKRF